jgi:2-dehydropantoate 2-reductase
MFVTFEPEHLAEAIGSDRCTFGMPAVMANWDSNGKLKPTINPRQKTLHSDERWVNLFQAAGIPSAYEPDMPLWLRCHAPFTVAFESVSIAGQRRGGGGSWSEAMIAARGIKGGFAVVKGLGYRLYPASKARMNSAPTFVIAFMLWAVSRIGSFREVLATGLNESRSLSDVIVAAAAKAKPPLPGAIKAILAMKPSA